MDRIITFGEVMARLATPGFLRLRQALPGTLEVTFAGAEANVAASLALLGADVALVTVLPRNDLAEACVSAIRSMGVDTSYITLANKGRLGLYFLETGANQRPSRVLYDRDYSAISLSPPTAYDWRTIFQDAKWFHVTGVTPGLSQHTADSAIAAVKHAKQHDITVSCDLNFRSKLWRWQPDSDPQVLAGTVMRRLLPWVDVLIANEEDCANVLGVHAKDNDIENGHVVAERYEEVASQVADQFPQLKLIATTLRHSHSASHNDWGAMLYDVSARKAFFGPLRSDEYSPYEIRSIVDRVGGGDSFAAALIFALSSGEYGSPQAALNFAVAGSCLAQSIKGDFNFSTREEIDALANGCKSGRVIR